MSLQRQVMIFLFCNFYVFEVVLLQVSDYSLNAQSSWLKRRKHLLKAILDMVHSGAQKLMQAIDRNSSKDTRHAITEFSVLFISYVRVFSVIESCLRVEK